MSLYEWLFKWIIAAINDKLNRISGGAVKTSKAISFLDIYGFEVLCKWKTLRKLHQLCH